MAKSAFSVTAPPQPSIATRAELDALRAARPRLEPQRALTMDGDDGADVHRQLNAQAELRITDLSHRLETMRKTMKRDNGKAQVRGKPTRDFGR